MNDACESVATEAGKFGVKAIVVMGDVGKPEECKRIADETIKAFGAYEGKTYDLLMYVIDNEIHHRGQGYVYLRTLGIEPPAFYER